MTQTTFIFCKNCGYETTLTNRPTFHISKYGLYEENFHFTILSIGNAVEDKVEIKTKGRIIYSFCNHCQRPIKAYLIYDNSNNKDELINILINHIIDKKAKETKYIQHDIYKRFKFDEKEDYVEVYECIKRYDGTSYKSVYEKFFYKDYNTKEESIGCAKKFIEDWIEDEKKNHVDFIYFIDCVDTTNFSEILDEGDYIGWCLNMLKDSGHEDFMHVMEHFEEDIRCPICNNTIKLDSSQKQKCHKCNGDMFHSFTGKPI